MEDWEELWHLVSLGLVHAPICRAGEDSESEVVLGEISSLNYVFFAQ